MTNKRCKPVNWRQQCQEQEGWVAYPDTQDWHAPITGGVQRALSRRKSLTLRPGFMGKLSNPNLSPLSTWNTHILFVLKPASFQIRGEVQLKAVQGLLMCFFLPPPSLWTFRCASWSQLMIVSCSKQHLKTAAVKAWQSITKEETHRLVMSMGSRLQAVITCKGFSKKY